MEVEVLLRYNVDPMVSVKYYDSFQNKYLSFKLQVNRSEIMENHIMVKYAIKKLINKKLS